jgi:NTE family protein
MNYPFRNLVFEGGGVKGIAYVGALDELEKRGILDGVERVGGASAGAINAVLTALRFSLPETRKILWALDFNSFLDDSWGVIRDSQRLIEKFGWYKGDFFRGWIGNLLREKTGNEHSTFNDLRQLGFRDLYVMTTNLSTGFSEVYSVEHTPRARVADAVRMSMSIPLFFAAVRNMRDDVYVDGGVLENYPVKLFDRDKYVADAVRARHTRPTPYYETENKNIAATSSRYVYNKETLGFRLDSKEDIAMFRDGAEPPRAHIGDFFEYAVALVKTVLKGQDNQHLHSDDWHRTVYIDTVGVGTTDFDISDKLKKRLVQEGKKGVQHYFDWYDREDPNDMPVNHPDAVD